MARRFRGSDTIKVDGKGRISIPAAFRRVIAASDPDYREGEKANVIIVFGDQNQTWLDVYTVEAMAEVEAMIDRMPRGSDEREALEDLMSGYAMDAEVDADGRMVLPARLREKMGLADEVTYLAKNDYFQLWSPLAFRANEARKAEALRDKVGPGRTAKVLLDMAPPGLSPEPGNGPAGA